jgi:hypothetical protein
MNKPTPLFLLLSAAFSASCNSATGPRPFTSVDELAGSWVMLENTAIQIADSTKRLDAMALYGIAYDSLAIAKGGTFLNSGKSSYLTSVDTGTITLANGILTWKVVRGGTPLLPLSYFQLAGSGNDMIWSGIDTSYADFNNDGLLDPGHQRIWWHRS